ncbi:MFS transporter [[Actinomadura] parvosata]|uniref:MFS transporter n=1 Tax=[Actinomadura] parvosata TaxID=1955412 RepID=UPI001C913658|nr:MFS transporter [Nonomuraea sp. ATCC 55076]
MLWERRFVLLWCGTTASGLATWALPFVLGLAVLDRTLSAADLGVVLAARTAGFLAAVPIGGVLADRYSRRSVVLWAGLAAALATPAIALGFAAPDVAAGPAAPDLAAGLAAPDVVAGLAAPEVVAGGGGSVVLMAVAAAIVGAGQGACRPAFQALTAEVVDGGRRRQANAAVTLAVRVTTLVAPAGTALLASVLDTRALLVGTALLWLIAALLPPRGLPTPAPPPRRARLLREFGEGVREARRHPWFVAGLAALAAVIFTGYSVTGVALPLVSRDRYGTEAVLAAALTAYTLGALAGALLVARWSPRAQGWTALTGLALYGCAPLSLLLPVHPAVVFAAYAVAGLGIELFNVPWFTATQREVEPRLLARVSSLDFLVSYGLAPVGLAFLAPAVEAFGLVPVLAGCTLVCFLAPAVAALAPGSRGFSRTTA